MRIYEFPTFTSAGVVDSYNSFVSDNIADTINSSYGACETANIFSPKAIQKVEKQGLGQGQIFHASSGDSGQFTFGCSNQVSILTPADTPQTVAIGGTHLTVDTNGNYTSETYWDNGSGAGGGGVSTVFKVPGFQKKVPTITKGGRNEPDVSYDADPNSGEAIVFQGQFIVVGGTSLASPIFGGCMVELEQVFGNRISGQFNKGLYKSWLKLGYGSSPTLMHDITTGTPSGILVPGVGYDLATGLGTLDCFTGGQAYLK
jgi:pseudomonalisin